MPYLTNDQRIDLDMVGVSDRPLEDVQAAVDEEPVGCYVEFVPQTIIGTVVLTTPEVITELEAAAFSSSLTDRRHCNGDLVYAWTTTDASAVISADDECSTDITFSAAGTYDVTLTVTSATSIDSPVEVTTTVTVDAAPAPEGGGGE